MRGLGKFFFGGLLGAVFGFLVSPKRAQRVRDALFSEGHQDLEAGSPQLTAAVVAEETVFEYPSPRAGVVSRTPAEPEPEFAFQPEPEPEPEVEPEPYVPPSVTSPEEAFHLSPRPAEESPPEYEPPVFAAVPIEADVGPVFTAAPVDFTETMSAPEPEPALQPEPVFPFESADSATAEPVLALPIDDVPLVAPAPEILDQPLADSGWAVASPPAEETTSVESPTSVESLEREVTTHPTGTTDLKARIEETRRRIQRELEQPFAPGTMSAEHELGPVFETEPAFQPFAEQPSLIERPEPEFVPRFDSEAEEASVAEVAGEDLPSLGDLPAPEDPPAPDTPSALEAVDVAAPVSFEAEVAESVESVFHDEAVEPSVETTDEPPNVETPAPTWQPAPPAPSMWPEAPVSPQPSEAPVAAWQPEPSFQVPAPEFVAPFQVPALEPVAPFQVSAPEPVDEPTFEPAPEAVAETPVVVEDDSGSHGFGGDVRSLSADLSDEAEVDRIISEDEDAQNESSTEGDFNHEAMRRRIEETRNRLKAKAFDAMMKGESVLLSRDAGESSGSAAAGLDAAVDSEVAETIDTTLTEEDV